MCGITGFAGLNDKARIRRMTSAIVHRGPDDFGYFSDKNIELGNRRLAIIDLSKKGHQPMSNEDGDVWITYNGEIYNFQPLCHELEARGHKFKSDTDTETIVHAYEEYGEECVQKLNGMFAFAIWDARKGKKQLFLARDRIGIKPLYYTYDGKMLAFASEIKALLEFGIKREVDRRALSNYLTYTYTPGPLTMLKDVKKLMPGHLLVYENGKIKIKRYWDFNFRPEDGNEEHYSKLLLKTLKESVKRHLIADVPVGHFLSGGIDSSSILAMISIIRKEEGDAGRIRTFSIGFGSREVQSELGYARNVAERFRTDHQEIVVDEKSIRNFPRILWSMDEPMPNITLIPLYEMAKAARNSVKVVTTGNAGDELFAGYRQHSMIYRGKKYYNRFPYIFESKLTSATASILGKCVPGNRIRRYARFAKEFLPSLKNEAEAYNKLVYLDFDENEKRNLFWKRAKIGSDNITADILKKKGNLLNNLTLIDLKYTLPDQYLLNDDKLTMANSLESRVPFLDNAMLDFAKRLPPHLKLRGKESKYILKRAMARILPKETIKRRKYGFTAPLSEWYGTYLYDAAHVFLAESEVVRQGFFNKDYIGRLMQNSKDDVEKINKIILLLTFEIWHRMFIDGERPEKVEL